ncbi:unnamed protein product [Cuscuta epithymum]|uniref:Uncharacterized protein n=1 Tax=Cuscuta epithymum TaxID=186058 RepID=A0AAV0ENH9_9ASTE|nr:unnamed protein product [Cuscuta epithymum]
MDLLNLSVSTTPLFFGQLSFVPPLSSSINHSSRLTSSKSKRIHLLSQNLSNSLLPNHSRFRVSAHFNGRSNRRNYLRRKIGKEQHQEVSGNSVISAPVSQSILENENFDRNGIAPDFESGIARESTQLPNIKLTRPLGDSALNKLENWVEQYRKDTQFWGTGTGTIFSVYQDSGGKVERVVVNEDEIVKRSKVLAPLLRDAPVFEDLSEVNEKLSIAKSLAREMESGNNVISTNSTVTKFYTSAEGKLGNVLETGMRGFSLNLRSYKMLPNFGFVILCGLVTMWAMKMVFLKSGNNEQAYTALEKEMLRRKREARVMKAREVTGNVEVVQESIKDNTILSIKRPKLDKEKLMSSITNTMELHDKPSLPENSSSLHIGDIEFEYKVHEIRAMAWCARDLEGKSSLTNKEEEVDSDSFDALSIENDGSILSRVTANSAMSPTGSESDVMHDESLLNDVSCLAEQSNNTADLSSKSHKSHMKTKSRIITSVKEAREYLSMKYDKCKEIDERITASVEEVDTESSTNLMKKKAIGSVNHKSDEFLEISNFRREKPITPQETISSSFEQVNTLPTNLVEMKAIGHVNQKPDNSFEFLKDSDCERENYFPIDDESVAARGSLEIENSSKQEDDESLLVSPSISLEASTTCQDSSFTNEPSVPSLETIKDIKESVATSSSIPETPSGHNRTQEETPLVNKYNWLEKNFHVLEPVIKKMKTGFRDNYLVAKDKSYPEMKPFNLETSKYGGELEWMEDERLKGIVFKVRENELAGRDPFFLMNNEDKLTFFDGLEKKVEQENKQLLNLHEWLHANIENLDYGTDGISLYDPPQKIVPRWKGYPMDKIQDLRNSSSEHRKTAEGSKEDSNLMKPIHSSSGNKVGSTLSKKPAKAPKTIIEGSDGSTRAGKKYGKEFWEYTKKWSREFLESYNAETDPETKSVMKDIGKDLDRWITEKEIQEAGEVIDRLPEKGKKFIGGKLDKVRREMEQFGPQAVVSKYREYGDEKEEDYLWWLDLPHILCIEMYMEQEGEMKVGLYSLEMASDLELDPPPNHIIAFEDAGDCKNLCYIIQAHLESLGNGNAFVVAQQPKDAFREAKASGFGVTVIRKGDLQLNVDQRLEEVEEDISEIGSKIYHDKFMRERGVDIESLMKGVFGNPGKPLADTNKAFKGELRKLLESRRKSR